MNIDAYRTSNGDLTPMVLLVVVLSLALVIAALVTMYVAYPDRGQPIPHAAWLSSHLTRLRNHIDQ